jgi:O-antigen ligase
MKPPASPAAAPNANRLVSLFAALFGAFLGLTLLKFGNPPIMEKFVNPPADVAEFVLGFPWPIGWGYGLLALVSLAGVFAARWQYPAPRWLTALPLVWLAWQLLAASQSIAPELSWPTIVHFVACVVCFYLGLFALRRSPHLGALWPGLLCGYCLVLAAGWEQRFGGLEATRRYVAAYQDLATLPAEYVKKITSNRIFATLFYPNSLAGALLLLLPPGLAGLWQARERLTAGARLFLMGVVALGSLACLFWSGSKGGWLLMLLLGLLALLRLPLSRALRISIISVVLLAGVAGFVFKYAGFFRKGAPSVSARFDYYRAAVQTAGAHPVFGTGPGTFAKPYQQIKRPESEMARMVHNDYLEQASDSGIPGFLVYSVFIAGALVVSARRLRLFSTGATATADGWLTFSVWLGVLGWALQGLMEFGLYLPALAWPAFVFLGWLLGRGGWEGGRTR